VQSDAPDDAVESIPLSHIAARATTGLLDPFIADGLLVSDLVVGANLRDAAGLVAPGAAALVADSCLGLAVVFQGRRAPSMATSFLNVEFSRDIPSDTRFLRGAARLRDINGALALAEGTIRDDAGVVIAHATMGAAIIQGEPIRSAEDRRDRPPQSHGDGTVRDLLSMDVSSSSSDAAVARFTAAPSLANVHGGLHGGVGVLMGQRTCDLLMDGNARLVALRAAFARPVPADGTTVTWNAECLHRGRRTAHCRAELSDRSGRLAVSLDAVYVSV
jgi:acyl-coenzyme A thioesterase PaaI-like protein